MVFTRNGPQASDTEKMIKSDSNESLVSRFHSNTVHRTVHLSRFEFVINLLIFVILLIFFIYMFRKIGRVIGRKIWGQRVILGGVLVTFTDLQ